MAEKQTIKVVSGAQTGVDRAALDAAISKGIEVGGWCPEGRKAEDGFIPDRYPVTVLPNAGYRQRTKQNVIDSDGTVVIYFDYLSGGTELTLKFCLQEKSPYLLLDADEVLAIRAGERIASFIERHSITILNVAGPRASGEPRAYDYAFEALTEALRNYS